MKDVRPPTRDSLLESLRNNEEDAFWDFWEYYEAPLIDFLRRKGVESSEASDRVRSFLLSKVLCVNEENKPLGSSHERSVISAFHRRRNRAVRYWPYLCRSLWNFHVDSTTGEAVATSEMALEDAAESDEEACDYASVAGFLLEKLFAEVKRDCEENNRGDIWYVIHQRLLNPVCLGTAPRPFESIAEELGVTRKQATNLMVTATRTIDRLLSRLLDEAVPPSERKLAVDCSTQRMQLRQGIGSAIRKHGVGLLRLKMDANVSSMSAEPSEKAALEIAEIVDPDLQATWFRLLSLPLGELIGAGTGTMKSELTLAELWRTELPNEGLLREAKDLGKRGAHASLRNHDPSIPQELGFAIYGVTSAVAQVRLSRSIGKGNVKRILDTILQFDWLDAGTRSLVSELRNDCDRLR